MSAPGNPIAEHVPDVSGANIRPHIFFAGTVAASIIIYWQTFSALALFSLHEESSSHIPLIPAISIYLLYVERRRIFESVRTTALVGALLILLVFGYQLTVIALIVIILLIGIVKKNGIMLVDFAIVAERDDHLSAHDAIRRAALLRFRPIMMTTMAAMLGGIPLMLGTGTGSEIRQPLGYAMVGGLIVSQALTLFTTPVIYLYLDQLSDWISSWRSTQPKSKREPINVSEDHAPVKA